MTNVSEVDEINNIDEVLEALRKVKEYCEGAKCGKCKLLTSNKRCKLVLNTPNNWELDNLRYM